MVTDDELRQIMPNLPQAKRALFLAHLQAAMNEFGITTMLREAAFLAQVAHESAEFRFMEEIWGPTPAQRRYEPVTSLSKMLGNTQPGDGKRFKGRGPIQLTGRANYKTFGDKLGIDLVSNPTVAATPEVAFRIAALFWQSRGLNPLADAQNFREITRRINGGFNGLADREKFYERAKRVLSRGDAAPAQPSAPPPPPPPTDGAPVPPPAGASAPKSAAKRAGAPAGGETDTGLSRGIMPGDPAMAKLLRADGGAAKKSAAKSAKKSSSKKAAKKSGAKKSAAKSSSKKSGAKKSSRSSSKKSSSKKSSAKKGAGRGGGGKKRGGGGGGAKKRAAKRMGTGPRGFK